MAALIAVINVVASVSLVAINKYLFSGELFPYTVLLSALHVGITALVVRMLGKCNFFIIRKVPLQPMLIVAVTRVAALVAMNLNLKSNSLGMYQLSKIFCLPVSATVETILGRKSFGHLTKFYLCLTIVGVIAATVTNPRTSATGLFIATIAVILTVLNYIVGYDVKRFGLTPLQMMYIETPISAILLILAVPMMDDTTLLFQKPIYNQTILFVLFTAFLAVIVNVSGFASLVNFSPTSYIMIGQCKTILVLAIGFMTSLPKYKVIAGALLSIVGLLGYTFEQSKKNKKDKEVKRKKTA